MTLTQLSSPCYEIGREGHQLTDIVLHWMDGTLADADARFRVLGNQVSAHYGIEDGVEHQYVQTGNTAWHAGTHAENLVSVGIEHSAAPDRPASSATIATSVARIVTLIQTNSGLSPDRIYGHSRFVPTQCPGTLPLTSIISQVRARLGGSPKPPYPGPLFLGSSGPAVGMVQGQLVKDGWVIPIDHVFGQLTKTAVGRFQTSRHLAVDGVVGPATWAALWA